VIELETDMRLPGVQDWALSLKASEGVFGYGVDASISSVAV